MKNKLFYILTALFCVISITCSAAGGKCGDNVTWELNFTTGVLTITGTGKMYDYSANNKSPWCGDSVKIRNVIINKGVTHIGSYAFFILLHITNVCIPEGVVSIGDAAFYACHNLQSIVMPNSIISIGESAFDRCHATSITIPQNAQIIGNNAFSNNLEVRYIYIPKSVKNIGVCAWGNCAKLQSIEVDPSNPYFCDIDGVLFSKDKETLLQFPSGKKESRYVVPTGTKEIAGYAFFHCDGLQEIILPKGLIEIKSRAFNYCSNLKNIVIPSYDAVIGYDVFAECHHIEKIKYLKGLEILSKVGSDIIPKCIAYPADSDDIDLGLPILNFKNSEINWGRFAVGEKKTAYFYFSNDNNQDVEILDLRSSFKVVLEKYNAQTNQYDGKFEEQKVKTKRSFLIPAHAKGRVNITYDSSIPQHLSKRVFIYTATDTIKLSLTGEAFYDENSFASFQSKYQYKLGKDNVIAFRDLCNPYGKNYSVANEPISVSKNNVIETTLHFIVQSGTVSTLDVLVDGAVLARNEKRQDEPLSFILSADTISNKFLEHTLTFSFDTKKAPKEWGVVEKKISFLINGEPADGKITFQYDILEDTVHLSKKERMQAPRISILKTDKNCKHNVWYVGDHPFAKPYTYTIKIQNTGKQSLIFRDDLSKDFTGTVFSLGDKRPADIDFVIDNKKFTGVSSSLSVVRYATVKVNKSIVRPNEIAELTITKYATPSTTDIMTYNEYTQDQYKYNLFKLTLRTNDPYQNYVDLYFLYSITDEPAEKSTDKPTNKSNDKPVDKPTDKPTNKPSDKPADKPANKPVNSTYQMRAVSHVLGDRHNDMEGVCFNLSIVIDDYQGGTVLACGKLFYKDSNGEWKGVKFSNNVSSDYVCDDNIVLAKAKASLSCCCPNSGISKYEVFLPYNAITHPSGKVEYKLGLLIQDVKNPGKYILNKNGGFYHDYYFSLNWPGEVLKPQYYITNVSHVIGDQHNDMEGICFKVGIIIDNYKGKTVFTCGKLCYKDNNGEWKDVKSSKEASNNYVCAGDVVMASAKASLSCCCPNSSNSQYEIFLPYNAITHPTTGKVDYKVVFWTRDGNDPGKFISNKNGGFYHEYCFSFNWPTEKPVNPGTTFPPTVIIEDQDPDFVDLGLPSGTLWKNKNEEGPKYHFFPDNPFSFVTEDPSKGSVPTGEQWRELMDHCTWT